MFLVTEDNVDGIPHLGSVTLSLSLSLSIYIYIYIYVPVV